MTTKVKETAETTEGTAKTAPAPVAEKRPEPEKKDGPQRAGVAASLSPGGIAPASVRRQGVAAQARGMAALQRSVGNARAMRMMSDERERAQAARAEEEERRPSPADERKAARVQTLAVSHPEDASEREAEAVARSVVAGRNAPPITPLSRAETQTLAHREEKKEEARREEKKAVAEEPPPAARLAQRMGKEDEQKPQLKEDDGKVQLKEDEKKPQRKEDEKRAQPLEEEQPRAAMRLEADAGGGTNVAAAEEAIEHKSAGSPVNPSLRRALEPRMGADLSAARVHQDSAANEAASALNARAFAHGNDIYLARGESENDTRLMAHELTHVVQQTSPGASGAAQPSPTVSRKESDTLRPAPAKDTKKKASGKPLDAAPGVLELKGMKDFNPPSPIKEFLEEHKGKEVSVRARFGGIAEGDLKVKKSKDNLHEVNAQPLPLIHPLFANVGDAEGGLRPSLVVKLTKNQLTGHVGLAAEAKLSGTKIEDYIEKAPVLIGMAGINIPKLTLNNKIDAGHLHLSVENATIGLGPFSGGFTLKVTDEKVDSFEGHAKVVVTGLAEGEIKLARNKEGLFTGQGNVKLALKKGNFTGGVDMAWDGSAITGEGKVGYQSEKMSGEVTLRLMEKGEAARLQKEKKAPPAEGDKGPAAEKPTKAPPKPKNMSYVVFGEGDLTFAFNEWLNGTAHVIVDPEGFVTIIGKITPQKEFELFEQKDFIKPLFKFEARAAYGIPVVGNVFIFANVGMDAFAKLGPAKFYNIVVEGTYSTNPEENKDFSISGSINISAAAGLRLTAQAGVGLEILGHDIKAGAGLSGIAGIKAYAEATPTIGYREKGAPGEDKKGEFFIRGDLEIAAQPFLGLSGELFVEIDTPWWSPLSDKRWTWPLFDKEYPIGGSFGMVASVDYVFGSKQWPAIEFKPVDFSADKFMSDLYHDKVKSKSAEEGDKKGEWKEKNTKDAEVPTGGSKGDAKPGELGEQTAAKSTTQSGGGKGGKKDVDDKATTADGKKVEDYKKKAIQDGKKSEDKDLKGPGGADSEKKGGGKEATPDGPTEKPVTMMGTQHRLIVTPGARPKVEFESKRDLLSNKIGRAVGKMMKVNPEAQGTGQIDDLKWLGSMAKTLQGKAIQTGTDPTKKLNQIPGFEEAFVELKDAIEAYGKRWKTTDIEELLTESTTTTTATPTLKEKVAELLKKAHHTKPADYTGAKHWRGNSEDERRESSTKEKGTGNGQFLYSLTAADVERLEKDAFLTGDIVERGADGYWAFKTFNEQIGYDKGKDAFLIRAEMTNVGSGTPEIHSHPRLTR
ncbi:MAG TPA: DUF4157 domain-containing protein [Pyrinomonadaceae bacterium]|nr:DUF4157 domain-containing protein [Pyrinomonadaceae bacterium]